MDAPAAGAGAPVHEVVLAVDSGGSGVRVALAPRGATPSAATAPLVSREPVRTGSRGIDADHLLEQLLPMARQLLADAGGAEVRAIAIGAAGLAGLGDHLRAELPAALARELGVRRVALVADAVAAYTGALGARPGAVVAAGTGLIALGTDLERWRRADGWGHLLGDCGGGAWIGRAGLEAALRSHDGRPGGSARLLARAEALFGPVTGLPATLYPRADRPAVLASFAPEVAGCAGNDPVAAGIMAAAARHIAESAAAVCPASNEPRVALTGGLFHLGDPLLVPVRKELARQLPLARPVPAEGNPLHGAVRIALALANDSLKLPYDEHLLHLVNEKGG
ncbi:ATPase [Streptomyces hygroscopicus]|uniref:N-acetylglucosamine kinase n=1 Tax=Streptomyces hygroscopicus TaxID=1912 RepID=UPI00223F640E|nr:BadF/BadG/BcrA/BcrD ATPase family protein [Streptomyces hygroscopicus]MCW7941742.1 ATPase [Streptomyces hygroscopicus]